MAKKDEFDFGGDDLDDLNFDDMDFGGDFGGGSMNDKRKPIEHFKDSFKNNVKSKLTDPGFITRLIKKVIPKGYVQAFDAYDALDSTIADIMKDNSAELNPYLIKSKQKMDRMNPTLRALIPKSLREAAAAADVPYHADSGPDELTTNIDGIDKLLGFEAKKQMEGEYRTAVKDIREKKRFTAEMKVSIAMAKGVGRLVGYQDTVLVNYHRKSLEIGYRQLDVGIRTLKLNQEYYRTSTDLFKGIMKNTGLPDFVKMQTKEIIEQQIKQRLAGAAMKGVGGAATKFLGNLKTNASEMLGGALQFNSSLNEGSEMGVSRSQMAGSVLGSLAAEFLGDKAEEVLGGLAKKLKPRLGNLPGVKKSDNFLRKSIGGIFQRANDYAKSDTDYDGKFWQLHEAAKGLVSQHSATRTVNGKGVMDLDKPAQFDNLFHKSVVEIIPAHLASIDRWVKTMATGKDQEETGFSHYTGSLVKRSTLNQQHLNLSLKSGSNVRGQVDSILAEMGAEQLTPEAKRAFRLKLMGDLTDGMDFKPERYADAKIWSKVDPSVVSEIREFVIDKFKIDKTTGIFHGNQDHASFNNDVRDKYLEVSNDMADHGAKMDIMSSVLGRRSFRELGLTRYNGNQSDAIDMHALHSTLLAGDETELKKKSNVDETPKEKLIRMKEVERQRQLKEQGFVDLEDDSQLRGSFADGGGRKRHQQGSNTNNKVRPTIVPPSQAANSAVVMPDSIKAIVEFPELFKASDEETHKRLDAMIAMSQTANGLLDYLARHAGGHEGGGPEGEPGQGPDGTPGKSRWRDYSIGNAAGHAAKTAKLAGKGLFGYLKGTYGALWKTGKFGAKAGFAAAKLPFASISGLGISDVHVMGDPEPALLAKGIRKGWYFDVNTEKTINTLRDITGPVKNREGDVILTQEEFDKGLYNGKGESLAGMGLKLGVKAAGLAGKLGMAYFGGTYGLIFKTIKKLSSLAVDQFTQFDAYFPGDTEPRIRSNYMKKGKYRQADGSPIFSLKEIKGPVFEMNDKGEMNEIVSQEEIDKYKSFYTRNGSLLFTIGKGFAQVGIKAAQLAARAALAYGKFVIKAFKGVASIGKKVIGGAFKFMGGRFGKNGGIGMLDEEMASASIEINVEQLKVQNSIYDLLKKKLMPDHIPGDVDGDGVREFSWKDILKRRADKASGKMGPAAAGGTGAIVDAIKTMNKDLDKKMDNLAEVTEKAGEESLLDQASDLADIKGHGKGRRGPKKVGKLKRAGGWLKKVAKKIPGAGMLSKAGSWLGRGAIAAAEFLPGAAAIGSAASVIGGAAMTAGGALLTGAGAVGSAIVGTLGIPLIVGAAVVGGAAYLGYKYYKSSQAKKYPILYLRMTQYGVSPTNESRVQQVLQLEGICKGAVTATKDGKASMDPKSIDADAFLKLFPTSDPEHQHQLMKWIATRFRPVFLAHCSAMQSIRGTTELVSADDGIGDGDIATFLQIVDMGGMQAIYDDAKASPFDSSLDTDSKDVANAVQLVKDRRKEKVEDKKAAVDIGLATGNAALVAKNTTLTVSAGGKSPDDIAKGLMLVKPLVGDFGMGAQVAGASVMTPKKSLDIPTAVRFKTYGLKEMSLDKAQQLQAVEEIYWDSVQYSGNDKAIIGGNPEALSQKVMTLFKPSDDPAREDLTRWLTYRFIPTFLQYNISCRRRFNGASKDASRNLTGVLMKEVLTEVTQTHAETLLGSVSVWTVTNSPWPKYDMETLPGSVTLYLDSLDTGDKSKVLNVDGMQSQKREAGQDYGTRMSDIAMGNTQANGAQGNVGATGPTLQNLGKVFGKGAVAGGVTGQSTTGQSTGALLMSGKYGASVEHPGNGTGGDINKLPDAKGKGWAAMGPLITEAANMVGFDPKIAAAIAGVESSFDPSASSGIAHGLYQFVPGTWKDMMAKYGATYGIAPGTPATDARANAILGVCYLKENYNGLSKTLGGNVSDVDLYTAHFLGLGGARKLLSAPRDKPASDFVGADAITNNESVFLEHGRMRSVSEVLAELDRRVDIGRKKSGQSSAASTSGIAKDTGGADMKATAASASGTGIPSDGKADAASKLLEADGPTSVGGAEAAKAGLSATAAAAASASGAAAGSNSPVSAASKGSTSAAAIAEIRGGSAADSGVPTSAPAQAIPASASGASAAAAQQSAMQQQAGANTDLSGVMQKLLEVSSESNDTLKGILEKLGNLKGDGTNATAATTPTPPQSEPARRNPLDTKRANAVT